MKHKRNLIITSLLLVLTFLVVSCGQAPESKTASPETKSETELPNGEDAIEKQQVVTQITIDGDLDDWSSYQINVEDSSGDHPASSPDIGNIRAFSNHSHFYVSIEFYELGNYDHFYFNIFTESNGDYQLTLFKDGSARIENKSTNKTEPLFAISAIDSGYEFKIPLSAVNNETINKFIANISLDMGNGDNVYVSKLFIVDEIESLVQPNNLKEITTSKEVLNERPVHFQLASGAKGEYTYRSFIHTPWGIELSPGKAPLK